MAIEARCPHCESTIRAADKYAGQQVKCPKCGGVMQVPGAAAPVAVAASATPPTPQSAVEEAQGTIPTTPAFGSDVPVVQVGDDEHWRKSVSRKKPAARKSSGSPAWLWPVAALAVCALVAAGLFVWNGQQGEVAADPILQPVEVAQSSTSDDSIAEEPATTSDDVTPTTSAEESAVADGSNEVASSGDQAE